jgi:NADH:ubiquinone oxidoreductase subunit 3 (subunit A)
MYFFFLEYFPVIILFIIIALLALVILGASYFLGVQKPDSEKVSIYECGFDPYNDARSQFNVRFYIIAILFMIFDLEAVLLFP